MIAWFKSLIDALGGLFTTQPMQTQRVMQGNRPQPQQGASARPGGSRPQPAPALPGSAQAQSHAPAAGHGASEDDETWLAENPVALVIDEGSAFTSQLVEREQALYEKIHERIEEGRFELPYLATTSVALIDLASKPNVDVEKVVALIQTDPSLSSELLKMANSVLYSARTPAETIHEATMRIGTRSLRSLVLSVSMRGAVFKGAGLAEYAQEVWRQAFSVGTICRAIAPRLAIDPDKAFLLGLLHDIGKVSLLAMLRRVVDREEVITRGLVGKTFYLYHEQAGQAMAKGWNLSEEFISVAGNHHEFATNEEFGRSAAIVSLAHRLDLYLSIGKAHEYAALVDCAELEFLGVPFEQRRDLLDDAQHSYLEMRRREEEDAEAAAAPQSSEAA